MILAEVNDSADSRLLFQNGTYLRLNTRVSRRLGWVEGTLKMFSLATTIQNLDQTGLAPKLADVPPFPLVAVKALQLISDEDGKMRELSEVISTDAAISSEILRWANSALFGVRFEVRGIFQAIRLLGFERVKALVVTIAMKSYLGGSLEVPALRACWRHNLACAVLSELFARVALLEEDVAYTAGLLHDVGRLALIAGHPKQYADFLESAEKEPCDVLRRERELFGIDHCQQGLLLVTGWKLPEMFKAVTSRHHDGAVAGEPGVVSIVRHGCAMADVLGFSVVPPIRPRTYEEILGEFPERERSQITPAPSELAHFIAEKINLIEAV